VSEARTLHDGIYILLDVELFQDILCDFCHIFTDGNNALAPTQILFHLFALAGILESIVSIGACYH
jgi:hypothetical protein